jgi:hypothetical protein
LAKPFDKRLNFTKPDLFRSGGTDAAVPEPVQILCRLSFRRYMTFLRRDKKMRSILRRKNVP